MRNGTNGCKRHWIAPTFRWWIHAKRMFTSGRLMEKGDKQKRYLLWPMKDILSILNMSDAEESYVQAFEEELSFRMFHRFLNEHKQYIYNKRIPNNTCLCEICELHVYFHSISSSQLILPQLQNINHVIVTLRNVCWGSVMNVMTMD